MEILHQIVQHTRRDERRQRGAETDIPDAQIQQRQQDTHRLLLIPREHQRQRQVVDPAAKGIRQGQRNSNGPVGVVTLSYIHQPRQSADGPKIQIVEAEFAAGQRQHHSVGGQRPHRAGGHLGKPQHSLQDRAGADLRGGVRLCAGVGAECERGDGECGDGDVFARKTRFERVPLRLLPP